MELTYENIKNNDSISSLIYKGNEVLGTMGFTEHSVIHAALVAKTAAEILTKLGYSEREIRLARIAGYMHDIGNAVNRSGHAHSGAILCFNILNKSDAPPEDVAEIVAAIGNHDEGSGQAFDAVSAALIIADKTDVRRDRVRNKIKSSFDMHDRVNYAAISSTLTVDTENKVISLDIELDEQMCTMLDYFEIFLGRMLMCRRAAGELGMGFTVLANGVRAI